MGDQIYTPVMQVFTSDGDPGVGYKLYTYESGTTTPKTVYTDEACTVAATNPVIFDSRGEATIYYADEYKFVLKTDADVTVWTVDSVGTAPSSSSATAYEYYPDAGEADQGVEGGADTIYAFIDDLSAVTDSATFRFRNATGTSSTTYTLSTNLDLSTYTNLKFVFDRGAVLAIDNGVTFTFDGVLEAGPYQIFSGAGTVAGNPIVDAVIPEWWGAKGDGTTDDSTAITSALDHFFQRNVSEDIDPAGLGVFRFLPTKNYYMETGYSKTISTVVTGGWKIDGYGSKILSGLSTGYVLSISGTSTIRHLIIEGLYIEGSGTETGILYINGGAEASSQFIYRFMLRDLYIESFSGNGITLSGSMFEGVVENCHIAALGDNVTGKCLYFLPDGENMSQIDVSNVNTYYGLNGIATAVEACNPTLRKCSCHEAYEYGIYLPQYTVGLVLDCTVENAWNSAAALGSGGSGMLLTGSGEIINFNATTNSKQQYGMRLFASNYLNVIGGSITGDVVALAEIAGTTNSTSPINWMSDGNYVFVASGNGQVITKMGGGYRNKSLGTSGTGEDTIGTYTCQANDLNTDRGFKIFAAGTKTGTAGNKTLKFYVGATAVTFHAAASDANDWRFEARVYAYSDAIQMISWVGYNATTILQGYDAAAEDGETAITMKITGECADGADSISTQIFTVDKI